MSLSKEDMSIFGLYPGHDDFFLVVCSHCGQAVKPQAFEKHCERRHGPLTKLYARLRSTTPVPQPQRLQQGHSPSHGPTNPTQLYWESKGHAVGPARTTPSSPVTPPHYRHSKNPNDAVRHSPLEKSPHSSHLESKAFKPPPPLEPQMRDSSPPSLREPTWPHGGTPPPRPLPSDRPLTPKKDPPLPSAVAGHRIPRPYNKVASKRECDLDKHCGVLDPDRKKVCTRLLTCNIHSIHQRRKVLGRSKNFDQLVAELKTKAREKGPQSLEGSGVNLLPSPETPKEQAGAPHCRRPLASLPAFSRPTASESTPEEVKQRQEEVNPRPPSPLVPGRLSSDDSEGDGPEEPVEFSSSASHPRPLAVCSFGSHVVGHGIFTFDRRLHHLRSALSSMLEQHISAHLWKKIPQVTDLQSPPSSTKMLMSSLSSSLHPKVRTGSHISSSLKTLSCTSSSRGPAKLTPSHSDNSGIGPSLAPLGSAVKRIRPSSVGHPKNPVCRTSKQLMKLREEAVDAATLRKRKAPCQDGEHSGPDRNCIPQQEWSRPSSTAAPSSSKSALLPPLPHGQTNGTLSPGTKPRPQPSLSDSHWAYRRTHPPPHSYPQDLALINHSHGRGPVGDSGPHSQATARSLEHHSLLKKHKGGVMEERPPTSKSPAPQHRLPPSSVPSTPHRSNFYPWKDSKSGGLSGGLEKKLAVQKPKLHH